MRAVDLEHAFHKAQVQLLAVQGCAQEAMGGATPGALPGGRGPALLGPHSGMCVEGGCRTSAMLRNKYKRIYT